MTKAPKKNTLHIDQSDPILDDLLLAIEADAAVDSLQRQQPHEQDVMCFRLESPSQAEGFVALRSACNRPAETMFDRPPLRPSELETTLDLAEEGKATEVTPPLSEEEARKRSQAVKAASASYKRPDFLSRSAAASAHHTSIPASEVVTELLKKASEIKKKASAKAKEPPQEAASTIHGLPSFFTDATKCSEPPQPPPLSLPPQEAIFDGDASLNVITLLSKHPRKGRVRPLTPKTFERVAAIFRQSDLPPWGKNPNPRPLPFVKEKGRVPVANSGAAACPTPFLWKRKGARGMDFWTQADLHLRPTTATSDDGVGWKSFGT